MAVDEPVTIWRDTQGLSEFSNTGVNYIDDPGGFYLVDPTSFYIVDTGVTQTLIPATIWEEEDNI